MYHLSFETSWLPYSAIYVLRDGIYLCTRVYCILYVCIFEGRDFAEFLIAKLSAKFYPQNLAIMLNECSMRIK